MNSVHLSVDDVIYSFIELIEAHPKSVFDVEFFKFLKELNVEFGAVFTLYCYENYSNEFFVKQVPAEYWNEIQKSGFIRVGYHGTFSDFNEALFNKQFSDFYKNIPDSIYAKRLRLHRYICNEKCISLLKDIGVNELLCREDKSRELLGINDASYILSCLEEYSLNSKCLLKDGITYRKTDIRVEFYDKKDLKKEIEKVFAVWNKDILIVYTHEKNILENKELLKNAVGILKDLNLKFVF